MPAGFLSAMLQGVEAEGGEDRRVVAAEDAGEHAALVAHAVLAARVEVVVNEVDSGRGPFELGGRSDAVGTSQDVLHYCARPSGFSRLGSRSGRRPQSVRPGTTDRIHVVAAFRYG